MFAVEIRQALGVVDLVDLIKQQNSEYSLSDISEFSIKFISDGRSPLPNSVCFVESVAEIKPVKNVFYIAPEAILNATCIVVNDPRYAFIKLLSYFQENDLTHGLDLRHRERGVHPSSKIHSSVIIEPCVVVGQNSLISAGCVLKKGTVIGSDCIVRENTVIGCDGIALYKAKNDEVLRFPHLSGVEIGNNVEIGANSVIVKGTLAPTKIEDDVVIGNLCNIGHGVIVKTKVWMSVGTLIGGNCIIENRATIGLGVAVKDNLQIAENTSIGMGSVVTKSTDVDFSYFGNPAKPIRKLKTGPSR